MARWKLSRITFGNEEFTIAEGEEVTLGRGISNTISLSSIVVSRNHCVINVQAEKVLITDLKSSNGIYVGLKKISPNTLYTLRENDIIGIGWTEGAPVANIKDQEKYMFKLTRDKPLPITSRIKYQSDDEFCDIKTEVAALTESSKTTPRAQSPVLNVKPPVKRKLDAINTNIENANAKRENFKQDEIIRILSDSDSETVSKTEIANKKPKLEPISEDISTTIKEEPLKIEKEDLEYDAFNVKQEYLGYDDEAIQIDSDSDDDDESVQWLMRLSQSSPGKPFMKVACESNNENEESSYSQMDDFDVNAEEEFIDDLITIPPPPPQNVQIQITASEIDEKFEHKIDNDEENDFAEDLIRLDQHNMVKPSMSALDEGMTRDVVDGSCRNNLSTISRPDASIEPEPNEKAKRTQMIQPLIQLPKTRTNVTVTESKHKSYKHSRDKKSKKHSSPRRQITNSQKEERKRKLKEIATKEKEQSSSNKDLSNSSKTMVNVKVTSTNRGAFLTDVVQGVVKPMKRKESPKNNKSREKSDDTNSNNVLENEIPEPTDDIENKKKTKSVERRSSKRKEKEVSKEPKSKSTDKSQKSSSSSESRVPLKSLKPLSESEESFSGKPFSKVEPMPKQKKKVRFTDAPPEVHVFQIEDGNNMKKTSLVKTSLVDIRQMPVFSLEKITLMKILRWNPHWLEEQINNNDPPPILGHNNPPMTIFHSFTNHNQYVQLVGDLLLMEIWEGLTQGYMRTRGQTKGIQMRIASLPPVPTNDRCFELFSLSVNVSVPNNEARSVPRMGEVLLVAFGPESARNQRFFFVHNVRCLPSPPNNKNSFFCISLHACYTDKMRSLKAGELMIGMSLEYIQKELMLFQAMEHLAGSPLSEAILRPEARHFVKNDPNLIGNPQSQWTKTLNPSQQMAVFSSVSAALGDRPCIQMVQGPPGTGKSSVICAMVMSYFYDSNGRRQQNRGKILICATSNAAVDELVCRLLNIRQNLPKGERFRMVRVGRPEAMHPRAHDISSQQLAQRDAAARHNAEPTHPGLSEEISHLEAKINMWKTQEQDTKDPTRKAYCNSRVSQLINRITLLRGGGGSSGGGGEVMRAEQLVAAERRIIEGADIVVTTLASAHNHKMRGLRRRIALCIVDEAGQAIEPETLIPLTLDVTRLTLIGDPQQLPGFICSQRAKKHGLGESLFSRLTSCAEQWPEGSPVVLLNQQYRMQPDIADYPNRAFYAGRIRSVPPPRPDIEIPPYSIVAITSGDKGQGASGANEMEAWGVSRVVVALNSVLRAHNLSLAVITPYNAHKELIKKNLRALQDPSEVQIEVNTVDSFQGQERDVVVVSLARSAGVGFLTDAGRMNVILTRARHALLVCLNPHAMIKNYQWRTLVEDAQRRNLYRVLPNKLCQVTTAEQTPPAEVLKYISYQKPLSAKNNCK